VAELTDLKDLSVWGEDARLICRRERPHPGAQLSLFDTSEGFRHTCFITNANALEINAAALECRHRGHARVEDRVRCWKDCGLQNLPFASFTQNLAWVATSLIAGALIAWAQMTCLGGELKKAEPKTLRYRLLHVGADPRAPRAKTHLALGRDLAVGCCTQASFPPAAGRVPITSGVPAPDPTTVSLPRA
jgi:hypothetical protein